MRRSYITPEFHNNYINGTFNIKESSTFFGSKMLEIEDSITIGRDDIIWYENENNEQLNLSIETSTQPVFFSLSDSKLENHNLYLDTSQPKIKLDKKWIMNIKIKKILINTLFANFKKYRTFEGVKYDKTAYNNVDNALLEYIKTNVLDRYKFNKVELFIRHRRIDNSDNFKLENKWNPNLVDSYNNFDSNLNDLENELKISFNQLDSSKYSFEYYFNLNFIKI